MQEDYFLKLRNEARENAFHSFAYQYIFRDRIKKYESYINWLKGFGIGVPAIIGTVGLGYGLDFPILIKLMPFAILATIVQFLFSLIATFGKWEEKLSYSYEAAIAYNSLHQKYQKIADYPPNDSVQLKAEMDIINNESNNRDQQDFKQQIQEKEQRKGMRFSLRNYQKACVACNIIPTGMKSTNCDVCGNF